MSKLRNSDFYPPENESAPPVSPAPTNPTDPNASSQSPELSMSPYRELKEEEPKWIEIPKHRILQVPLRALSGNFEGLDENGKIAEQDRSIVLCRRIKDGKLFKQASFMPIEAGAHLMFYLEEV